MNTRLWQKFAHWRIYIKDLNGGDSPNGRIFTMIHELVHLYLVHGGVIRLEEDKRFQPEEQDVEIYANHAAAATLVPRESILAEPEISDSTVNKSWPEDILKNLCRRYSVSKEVILRRLVTLGLASRELYKERRDKWESQRGMNKDNTEIRIKMHIKTLAQVGCSFGQIVLEGYRSGKITMSEVSDYLDLKPKHFNKFENHLSTTLFKRRSTR